MSDDLAQQQQQLQQQQLQQLNPPLAQQPFQQQTPLPPQQQPPQQQQFNQGFSYGASRSDFLPRSDNGCEMLNTLWKIAEKDLDMSHPGLTGVPARISSFIELRQLPEFMSLAAIKCWEERTRNPGNTAGLAFPPMPYPSPADVRYAASTAASSSASKNVGSSSGSGSSGSK